MADISKCQEELIILAEKQGYLTFDDILNASDAFSLSVTEVDFLSEAIQLRGIIVYETAPNARQESDDEEFLDYSRTDYNAIFAEVLDLAPQLKTLLEEIKGFPAPQWGEINILAMQIAEGNQFARQRLISLYMRNVVKIALSMAKQNELDIEDAISSGFSGLLIAVDKFDPAGFSAFHSYASMWITQGIQRDCNPIWMDYYFPAHYKDRMYKAFQKYEQYTAGETVGSSEYSELVHRIADELEMEPDIVFRVLESAITQKYGKECFEEYIEFDFDHTDKIPEELIQVEDTALETLMQKDLSRAIEEVLSSLSDREAMVIRMRNGIGYDRAMTLEEIGSLMDVTRERIRQIEAKAMRRLTHPSRKKKLEGFI